MKILNRRDFVKNAVMLTGGAALAPQAWLWPRPARAAEVNLLEETCGAGGQGKKRILVAYASMHGSTGEVARAMGQACCARDVSAEVRPVRRVDDLSGYEAAIIGSAIRSEAWLPEATEFVVAFRKDLRRIPVAYFLTCLTLSQPRARNIRRARGFLDPVLSAVAEVRPVSLGLFGGLLDFGRLPFGMRAVMKYKMWQKKVAEGDYRNWNTICVWAGETTDRLLRPGSAGQEVAV